MKKGISVLLILSMILSAVIVTFADYIEITAELSGITAEIPYNFSYAYPSVYDADGYDVDINYKYQTPTSLKLDFDFQHDVFYKLTLSKNGLEKSVDFKIGTVYSSESAPLEVNSTKNIVLNEIHDGISFKAVCDTELIIYPKDFEKFKASGCVLKYSLKTDDSAYDISSFIVSDTFYYHDTASENFFYKLAPGGTKFRHTYNNPNVYWDESGKAFLKTDGSENRVTVTAGGGKTAIYSDDELILSSEDDERLPDYGGIAWRICAKKGKTYSIENVRLFSAAGYDFEGKDIFYVDTNGSDSAIGTKDAPYETLAKATAQAAKSNKQDIEIIINPGTYNFKNSVLLHNINKKLAIKANGDVKFTAVNEIERACIKSVTDDNILSRLNKNARDKIIQINLPGNLKSYFDLSSYKKMPDFYQDGEKLTLSRWPDFDYNTVESVIDSGESKGSNAVIGFSSEVPLSWSNVSMTYMDHYGSNDWCREWTEIKEIDKENKTIVLNESTSYPFNKNKRWSAVNVLEEIDLPGEYCADWDSGVLYIYPNGGSYDFEVCANPSALIDIKNSSNITISGIEFSQSSGAAVNIDSRAKGITISDCVFHDIDGISVSGTDCTICGNSFYNMTGTSIALTGGDRETLTPSGNIVKNNHISALGSYRSGYGSAQCITLSGTGSVIAENIIHGSAAEAVRIGSGNNNIISNNEMYNVINASADAGVIYAGADFSSYGNVIRDNYIHDFNGKTKYLTEGNYGIYIDDWFSGITIENNVLGKTSGTPQSEGIYIANGRDNKVSGNLMFNLSRGIKAVDRFVENDWIPSERKRTVMGESLFAVNTDNTPFGNAFPQISVTKSEYLKAYEYPNVPVTERTPEIENFWRHFPKNNIICGNTSYSVSNKLSEIFSKLGTVENNVLYSPQIPSHSGVQKIGFEGKGELNDFDLIYPADGIVRNTDKTKLLWENAAYADEYRYELSTDKDFTNIVFSGTTISNGAEITSLDKENKYYVRVTAKNTSAVLESEKLCGYQKNVSYDNGTLTVHSPDNSSLTVICAVKNGGRLNKLSIQPSGGFVEFFPGGFGETAEIYFINLTNMSPFGEKISVDLLKGEQ